MDNEWSSDSHGDSLELTDRNYNTIATIRIEHGMARVEFPEFDLPGGEDEDGEISEAQRRYAVEGVRQGLAAALAALGRPADGEGGR